MEDVREDKIKAPDMSRAYEKLIRYAKIPTASDDSCPNCPSTERQWKLAKLLKKEMEEIGMQDVFLDEHCYLYGFIPENGAPDAPVLGLIAHMDVSGASPSEEVMPRTVSYGGGDIVLNKDSGVMMKASDFPNLKGYAGKTLIVTDGTTLLGADDKAGIAEIMTAAETLLNDKTIKHGKIAVAFTPDEEIGRGADLFDLKRFGADFAFTSDGGKFGEVSYENFNASSAEISFKGRSVHPGSAKGIMINAQLIAMEYFSLLPKEERPELTEGREGFFLLEDSAGTVEHASQKYIMRDHDAEKLRRREKQMIDAAGKINEKFGPGTAEVTIRQNYRNMAEIIAKSPFLIEIAQKAISDAGGTPFIEPIRGGTDGAMLTFKGLPCPNLGTGSENHHGRLEFACAEDMDAASLSLVKLAEICAERSR